MADSLNLDNVIVESLGFKQCKQIMACLIAHEEFHKDEQGRSTVITIRQLLNKYVPTCPGLLKEYVCAFGRHGQTVITRYVSSLPNIDVAKFQAEVLELSEHIRVDVADS